MSRSFSPSARITRPTKIESQPFKVGEILKDEPSRPSKPPRMKKPIIRPAWKNQLERQRLGLALWSKWFEALAFSPRTKPPTRARQVDTPATRPMRRARGREKAWLPSQALGSRKLALVRSQYNSMENRMRESQEEKGQDFFVLVHFLRRPGYSRRLPGGGRSLPSLALGRCSLFPLGRLYG